MRKSIFLWCGNHQMHVVASQAVGIDMSFVEALGPQHHLQVERKIRIFLKPEFAVVAADSDVVHASGKGNSWRSHRFLLAKNPEFQHDAIIVASGGGKFAGKVVEYWCQLFGREKVTMVRLLWCLATIFSFCQSNYHFRLMPSCWRLYHRRC